MLAAAALALAACARSAPDLPADLTSLPPAERLVAEDRTSPDFALDCEALAGELLRNRDDMANGKRAIQGERDKNQAVGIVANLVFPPLWLAAEHSTADKAALDALQQRRDRLLRLQTAISCAKR